MIYGENGFKPMQLRIRGHLRFAAYLRSFAFIRGLIPSGRSGTV
jgi:hypothetical protein